MSSFRGVSGSTAASANNHVKGTPSSEEKKNKKYGAPFYKDLLCFVAYFLNNLFYYFYIVFAYKLTFVALKYLNDNKFLYLPSHDGKLLEFTLRVLLNFVWFKFYTNLFDGDVFTHIFYYRYKLINGRETFARVLGTLSASVFFARCFYVKFGWDFGYSRLLGEAVDVGELLSSGKVSGTFLDTFLFPNLHPELKDNLVKNYVSLFVSIPELKFGPNYFSQLERFWALLVDNFLVEFFLCFCLYSLLTFCLTAKNARRYTFLRSVCKRAFAIFGEQALSDVNGKVTLDTTLSVCLFFKDGNVYFLFVRVLANFAAAVLVPRCLPLPTVISYDQYQDVYVNSSRYPLTGTPEDAHLQLLDLTRVKHRICFSQWPDTLLGKVLYKFDKLLERLI